MEIKPTLGLKVCVDQNQEVEIKKMQESTA